MPNEKSVTSDIQSVAVAFVVAGTDVSVTSDVALPTTNFSGIILIDFGEIIVPKCRIHGFARTVAHLKDLRLNHNKAGYTSRQSRMVEHEPWC